MCTYYCIIRFEVKHPLTMSMAFITHNYWKWRGLVLSPPPHTHTRVYIHTHTVDSVQFQFKLYWGLWYENRVEVVPLLYSMVSLPVIPVPYVRSVFFFFAHLYTVYSCWQLATVQQHRNMSYTYSLKFFLLIYMIYDIIFHSPRSLSTWWLISFV